MDNSILFSLLNRAKATLRRGSEVHKLAFLYRGRTKKWRLLLNKPGATKDYGFFRAGFFLHHFKCDSIFFIETTTVRQFSVGFNNVVLYGEYRELQKSEFEEAIISHFINLKSGCSKTLICCYRKKNVDKATFQKTVILKSSGRYLKGELKAGYKFWEEVQKTKR